MAHLEGQERALYVQDMFTRIAGRYDLMNRLMTFGQDIRWRKYVIEQAQLPFEFEYLTVLSCDSAIQAFNQRVLKSQLALQFLDSVGE